MAAIIDLHLTHDGADALGVTVLDELKRRTPDVPRLLLTRNPPDESQMEVVRKYGLFDVYKKRQGPSGGAAPQLRSFVESMLEADGPAALRAQAESAITQLDKRIGRAAVAARRHGRCRWPRP